jgi:hypothetical protein
MQMWPECAPCIEEMISTVAHMALDDQAVVEFMMDVRRLPALIDPSGSFRPRSSAMPGRSCSLEPASLILSPR